MFGHDDNDEHKQDDTNQPGFVAPAANANDDNPGLGDESAHHATGGGQPDSSGNNGFIMDPVVPPAQAAPATPAPAGAAASDDLIRIKQEALQQLSPLVGHLDQNPEEKFRTLMMMIQASDDQTKLNEAYDAAKAITDEKVRAQALLDVVNEINYFTQQHK